LRVALAALGEKPRRSIAVAQPSPAPVTTGPTPVAPGNPLRFFDGFRFCAQGLWDLVRKHRQQDRVP